MHKASHTGFTPQGGCHANAHANNPIVSKPGFFGTLVP